jgi:hypothetical protein
MDNFSWTSDKFKMNVISPWIKSSLSHANGNCVEISDLPGGRVGIRHSRHKDGPFLSIDPQEFHAFLDGIRKGEFNFYPL